MLLVTEPSPSKDASDTKVPVDDEEMNHVIGESTEDTPLTEVSADTDGQRTVEGSQTVDSQKVVGESIAVLVQDSSSSDVANVTVNDSVGEMTSVDT